MATRSPISEDARVLLEEAIHASKRTLEQVSDKIGYTTHSPLWQMKNGRMGIPLGLGYKIGVAAGMSPEDAREFALVNMRDRDPELHELFLNLVDARVEDELKRRTVK